MNTLDALLAAVVCGEDGDDTSRLVYADCLQENGEDGRAALIRAQVEAVRHGSRPEYVHDLWGRPWRTGTIRRLIEYPVWDIVPCILGHELIEVENSQTRKRITYWRGFIRYVSGLDPFTALNVARMIPPGPPLYFRPFLHHAVEPVNRNRPDRRLRFFLVARPVRRHSDRQHPFRLNDIPYELLSFIRDGYRCRHVRDPLTGEDRVYFSRRSDVYRAVTRALALYRHSLMIDWLRSHGIRGKPCHPYARKKRAGCPA